MTIGFCDVLGVLGGLALILGCLDAMAIGAELHAQGLRRSICRRIGHYAIREDRGEPVLRFEFCMRCGKILG